MPKSKIFVIFFAMERQKSRQKGLRVFTHNLGLKPEAITIYLLWRCFNLKFFIKKALRRTLIKFEFFNFLLPLSGFH